MSFSGCRACPSYNRGAGTDNCLKCERYKEVLSQFTDRDTIRVVHVPQAIIEEVADTSGSEFSMLKAIRKLDPKDGACLLMQYYGRYSIDEMSEVLGVSKTVIDRRLKRSRTLLKFILSEDKQTLTLELKE